MLRPLLCVVLCLRSILFNYIMFLLCKPLLFKFVVYLSLKPKKMFLSYKEVTSYVIMPLSQRVEAIWPVNNYFNLLIKRRLNYNRNYDSAICV